MKKQNKQIGNLGESLAAKYLEEQGYTILERNWGNKWGEIDIICQYHPGGDMHNLSGVIVFVEVKTKTGAAFGAPTTMVNPRKLFQIQRLASVFPAGINQPKRIDVIAIVLTRERKLQSLNHYQAVY